MDILEVFILSLVEGLTEFLPISSTGHLMAAAELLDIALSDFLSSFLIFIQLGAILAVVVLYVKRLRTDVVLLKKIAAAWLPTALIGFALYSIIKEVLLTNLSVVAWSLGLGGAGLIIFERWLGRHPERMNRFDLETLSYRQAVIIGCYQALAIVPGVSRSGATIIGGLALGLSRSAIVEFSFLLAIPTMAAAVGYDLWQSGLAFDAVEWQAMALGFALSFIFSLVAIKWLLAFVQKHDFSWFGVYRIVVAVFIYLVIIS